MSDPKLSRAERAHAIWSLTWRLLLVIAVGVIAWATLADQGVARGYDEGNPWILIDPVLGLIALCILPFRRRHPMAVLAAMAVLASVAASATGAILLVLASVASRREPRAVVMAAAASLVSGVVFGWVHPKSMDNLLDLAMNVLLTGFVVAVGMYVGTRRELVENLRRQVATAQREQELRVAQARTTERARIAREMHDVLAHRISLVAMHAGALAYRTDLPPEQTRRTADLVQTTAHQALIELREVLGVLRDTDRSSQDSPEPPQPSLVDLEDLIEASRSAGEAVDLRVRAEAQSVPQSVSRAGYRIVQEALTNARKHAPGKPVQIEVAGSSGHSLTVLVTNGMGASDSRPETVAPPSGLGLIGLRERAHLAGGELTAGPNRGGVFVVNARLPWSDSAPPAGRVDA